MSASGKDHLITVYMLRHLPSIQNTQGHGGADTKVDKEASQPVASDQEQLLEILGSESIDYVFSGTLKRHKETTKRLVSSVGYKGELREDERLTAFFAGPLLENPAKETEEKFDIKSHDEEIKEMGMDPEEVGVTPFDPLYSGAYIHKGLRNLVFPNEDSLIGFEDISNKVTSFQRDLVNELHKGDEPLKILSLGSCSPNGFNLEYSSFGTIGENIMSSYGSENRPIFPQDHNEMMILKYTEDDLKNGKNSLAAEEGNIKISSYINANS